MSESSEIRRRYAETLDRVAAAARRAGRGPEDITVVGVSKTFPPGVIREAYHAGLRHVGENRAQELVPKWDALRDLELTWHMVGHLQTNKINKIVGRADLLQSLDRFELAQGLQKRLEEPLDCLVEVKTAPIESAKHGVPPEKLTELLDELSALDRIRVRGLMTVGPLTDDVGAVRRAFRLLKHLYDTESARRRPGQDFRWLSMGMTGDYEVAIEEGATMVRIGTGIFGPRTG